MTIKKLLKQYHNVEIDRYLPFSEYNSEKIFDSFLKPLLAVLEWNLDDIKPNAEEEKSYFLVPKVGKKVVFYVASLQELESLRLFRSYAKSHSISDEIAISFVTTFSSTYIYYRGREVLAFGIKQLDERFHDLIKVLSKTSIETGKFAEYLNIYLAKDYDEELFRELNILRLRLAEDLVVEKKRENISTLTIDGKWDTEKINEIVVRIITRFLALRNAEDRLLVPMKGKGPRLSDIKIAFDKQGNLIRERGISYFRETLFNTLKRFLWDFDIEYNGGIFLWDEGTEGVMLSPLVFHQLLDFCTSWCFPEEHDKLIGATYERFLGQEIVVEEKRGKTQVKLLPINEVRGQRKASGIYYTPSYIVKYIIKNTLGEILQKKREDVEKAINSFDLKSFCKTLRAVKSLKTLDPACGSGSFLIKLLQEFKSFYEEIKEKVKILEEKIQVMKKRKGLTETLFHEDKEVLELESVLLETRKEVEELKYPGIYALKHNIYGVDLDPKAVTISAFTLMLQIYDELKDGAKCPALIDENLKIGNSLISSITNNQKVVGFSPRKEIENQFKKKIKKIMLTRTKEKQIDDLSIQEIENLVGEKYLKIAQFLPVVKGRYPNALPPELLRLLEDWSKKAESEGKEKAVDLLVRQTKLAPLFLKFLLLEESKQTVDKINQRINIHLIKYFNSKGTILKSDEFEEITKDPGFLLKEFKYLNEKASEISKSQPPKVFNWEIEFPEVFFGEDGTLKENSGFDVVVGNPPYLSIDPKLKNVSLQNFHIFKALYESFHGQTDIYVFFYERGTKLLKKQCKLGFISKNRWQDSPSYELFCDYLSNKDVKILDFDDTFIFDGVGVTTNVILINNIEKPNIKYWLFDNSGIDKMFDTSCYEKIEDRIFKKGEKWDLFSDEVTELMEKKGENMLISGCGHKITPSEFFIINRISQDEFVPEDEMIKDKANKIKLSEKELRFVYKFASSGDIFPYTIYSSKDRYIFYLRNADLSKLPNISRYFEKIKPKNACEKWYEFHCSHGYRNVNLIEKKTKIIFPNRMYLDRRASFCLDTDGMLIGMDCSAAIVKNKKVDISSLIPILNSSLIWYYCRKKFKRYVGRQTLSVDQIPIKLPSNPHSFSCLMERIISLKNQLYEKLEEIASRKVVEKYIKRKITLNEVLELVSYVDVKRELENKELELLEIKRGIDRLVYDLYGLTEEEVKTVERTVWGQEFENMYGILPDIETANTISKKYQEKTY